MGLTDLFSDIYSAFTFTDVQAEAPDTSDDHKDGSEEGSSKSDEQTEEGKDGGEESTADDEGSEGGAEEGHHGDEGEDGGSGDGDAVEEEKEEEEEEEEPVDIKPKLEEDCAKSKQCAPAKNHYDECVERVMEHEKHESEGKKGPKEDCVEEFFHLTHCATQCAAPKLFAQLK